MLLVLAGIWGASYLLIEIGLREMGPGMVVFGRVFFAALVLIPLSLRRGALADIRGRWHVAAFVALVQVAGPFLLVARGQEEITSSLAGILVASVPIFSAVLAIFFFPEDRVGGIRAVGVGAGIVGVGLLLGVDLSGDESELAGGLIVLLASLGYAIGGLAVKQRLGDADPIGVATAVIVSSTVICLPVAVAGMPESVPGVGPIASVVSLGLLGTGVAFAIFYRLMAEVGPSRTFLVTYLVPGFAVLYGATLLDEEIGIATCVGLALILGGSFLAAEGRFPWKGRADGEGIRGPAGMPGELGAPVRAVAEADREGPGDRAPRSGRNG